MRFTVFALTATLAAGLVGGCIPLVIGGVGAAAYTGSAAMQDRGISGRSVDARIQTDVNEEWLRADKNLFRALDMKVYNRRVLIMGFVPNTVIRDRAIGIARRVQGVREVIDEIQVGPYPESRSSVDDAWIETRIDSALALENGIHQLNYTTQVINGTVYIIGESRDRSELQKVIATLQGISGVRRVISYIEVQYERRVNN